MEQVQFRVWPWGVLAGCLPVILVIAVLPVVLLGIELEWSVEVALLLGCMGAWNAVILGLAVGDCGRTLMAVLAGVAAALLVAATSVESKVALVVQLMVWLAIGVAFPVRWSLEGLLQSVGACAGAAARQMVVGLLGGGLAFLGFRLAGPVSETSEILTQCGLGFLFLIVGNVWAMSFLFKSAYKADAQSRGGLAWCPDPEKLRSMLG